MAMRRPHEVLKVGRYLAAAGQAGLKPATTIRNSDSVYFRSNHYGHAKATRGDESGAPSRGRGAGGFETRHYNTKQRQRLFS